MKCEFSGYDCTIIEDVYKDTGNVAWQLVDSSTGEPIARATVNLDTRLDDGMVAIKEYSENAGMVSALVSAGLIGQHPVAFATSGHAVIPIHKVKETQ